MAELITKDDLDYLQVVNKLIQDATTIKLHYNSFLINKYKLKGKDTINELGEIYREKES